MKSGHRLLLSVLLVSVLAQASKTRADGFRLDRFRAAERADDAFSVKRLRRLDHLRLGGNAVTDYAWNPLSTAGADQVTDEAVLKLDASLDLYERAMIFVGVDAPLLMEGDPSPIPEYEADDAGLGDVSLGGRFHFWGEPEDHFALGAQATLILPTGGGNLSGEPSVAGRPELIASVRSRYIGLSANAGAVIKSGKVEFVHGTALSLTISEWLEAIGEIYGGIWEPLPKGSKRHLGLEALFGFKGKSRFGLWGGIAGGGGLASVYGTPDGRLVLQLGYVPEQPEPAAVSRVTPSAPPAAPPPAPPPAPPKDSDEDGIDDSRDICPELAEDVDHYADVDGCPDPDNDDDGIADADDRCPEERGDFDHAGCAPPPAPPAPAVVTEDGEISIREQIRFGLGDRNIDPESEVILAAVKAEIDRSQARRVRIEGHADSTGDEATNRAISRRRARAVGRWLTSHGVRAFMLELYGCGTAAPVADNATEEGRAANRRVIFQIVDPAPKDPARAVPPSGCTPAVRMP